MQGLLRLSDWIEALLKRIADIGAWAFIACIATITIDVVTRKFGFQIPELGSTRLQELEWHFHAILFCTWLGYAYMRNSHVRIDVFTGGISRRSKIWLELICCIAFALPYLYVAIPYAHDFAVLSYVQNETSEAPVGLAYRWVIKAFLYGAFLTVLLSVIAVIGRCVVALFAAPALARQAATPFAGAAEGGAP